MKSIRLIVKTTNACNMRCKYCYNSESNYVKEVLPIERFDKLMRLLAQEYTNIAVIWHGGEPLCCGLDYFRKAMEIEKELISVMGVQIDNSVQTNGTLIDNEWVKFFVKNNWKVGVSFDGVDNDKYRQLTGKTLAALDLLKKNNVKHAVMAVVSEGYDLQANYDYFRERKLDFEFSPLFSEGAGKDLNASATFAEECNKLFDRWLFDTEGVSVRLFYAYTALAIGSPYRMCCHGSCLTKFLGISPDGTLYNCSRHSVMDYPFGNVDDMCAISEAFNSEGFYALLKGSVERRRKCKESCDLFKYCGGGCTDVAIIENGLAEIPTESCQTFRTIFTHIKAEIERVMQQQIPLDKLNPTLRKLFAQGSAVASNDPDEYDVRKI